MRQKTETGLLVSRYYGNVAPSRQARGRLRRYPSPREKALPMSSLSSMRNAGSNDGGCKNANAASALQTSIGAKRECGRLPRRCRFRHDSCRRDWQNLPDSAGKPKLRTAPPCLRSAEPEATPTMQSPAEIFNWLADAWLEASVDLQQELARALAGYSASSEPIRRAKTN